MVEEKRKTTSDEKIDAIPRDMKDKDVNTNAKPKKGSVSFSSDTKPPSAAAVTNGAGLKRSVKRTYMGKADLKRDIPVFIFIMCFLAWVSYISSDVGKGKRPAKLKRTGIAALNEQLGQLAKVLAKNDADKRKVTRKVGSDCSLFLGSSSISGAGLSWFAGRAYQKDEVVLDATATHTLIYTEIAHVDFQLKHHPKMFNIKLEDSMYKASRLIEPGEEFFLQYDQHPHATNSETSSIFRNLPTPEEFGQASNIVSLQKKFQPPYPNNKKRGRMQRQTPKIQAVTKVDSFVLLRQAIAFLNPRVAALLPRFSKSLYELEEKEGPFEFAILRNRTAQWLEIHGHCMDIITKKEGKIAVQQKLREGERILVAPLYIRTKPSCTEDALQDDTCSSPLHPCLTHDKSKLLLCPLGTASSLKYSPTESNARYSWGQWNEFNFEANGRRNADEILNHHSNGMTLDVIASRDIDVGEEIVVASGAPNQMGVEALDGIYRLEWREQEETEAAM